VDDDVQIGAHEDCDQQQSIQRQKADLRGFHHPPEHQPENAADNSEDENRSCRSQEFFCFFHG